MTFYSYFRGGNLAGIGAEQAGYRDLGGVEFDPAIAAACDLNFPHAPTTVADVCAVDPADLLSEAPAWFHASPVCTNASQANVDAGETDLDMRAAEAVACFIRHWQPPHITIENVWQYRNFESFHVILRALDGYAFNYWHLNAADYSVPQTRKRLYLVASKTRRPQRPPATHQRRQDTEQMSMFEALPSWVGWHEAIADLIPTLPDSAFAPWQLERLPPILTTTIVEGDTAGARDIGTRDYNSPMFAIKANISTVGTRAFILDGQANDNGDTVTCRQSDEPMFTVQASGDKRPARAFLLDYANTSREPTTLDQDDPAMTIQAWHTRRPSSNPHAFLVGGANTSEEQAAPGVGVSTADEPTRCVNASNSTSWRAWLAHGRVVSMTPRCLARFMSVPDSYILPDKNTLAGRIIGNGVCPAMMRALAPEEL